MGKRGNSDFDVFARQVESMASQAAAAVDRMG